MKNEMYFLFNKEHNSSDGLTRDKEDDLFKALPSCLARINPQKNSGK